jgi:hypothetical protein
MTDYSHSFIRQTKSRRPDRSAPPRRDPMQKAGLRPAASDKRGGTRTGVTPAGPARKGVGSESRGSIIADFSAGTLAVGR